MITLQIVGMKELERKCKKLGKIPQSAVTKSAKAGMRIALSAARKGQWIDQTGEMRKGLIMVGEKSRSKPKKTYRIIFDPAKNDIFQKKNAQGQVVGYYPASQEYGFFARNGKYIPGYHFLSKALTNNTKQIKGKIMGDMIKNVDKIIQKG